MIGRRLGHFEVAAKFSKWYLPELVEQLIDGLRKAGLDVPPRGEA